MPVYDMIVNITSFSQYSWYISFYIGLFLLIPFLNLIYNHLSGKRQKTLLIITLLILTALPSVLNIFDFNNVNWLSMPSSSDTYQSLVPDYWISIFSITYYFLGAYLREFEKDIQISPVGLFFLFCFCVVLFGTFNYYRSYPEPFIDGLWTEWGSFENVIDSVLVFLFFLKLKTARMPRFFKKFFALISDLSLGIYLVSWIFDQRFYPELIEKIPIMRDRIPYYFIMVPFIFLCSAILSGLLFGLYKAGAYGTHRIVQALSGKRQK